MIGGKRVCVVMPAYNAEKTLEKTAAELDRDVADDVIVVDDASHDDTAAIARKLASTSSSTPGTAATAATRRPATPRPWPAAPTSW